MKLENERYEITFCTKGGEIESFLDKRSGVQYMWQGDDAYWSGKNPTLFPIIGNTFTGSYHIDGKTYQMKNHGLIRYAELQYEQKDENTTVFTLDADEITRKQYPFPFHYQITYTLKGHCVTIAYHITNTGDQVMPFSFGLHPGFRCPLLDHESFEDYTISFSNPERLQQIVFDPEKIKEPEIITHELTKDIPLSYSWIETYATVIYQNIKSSYVELAGPKHKVRMSLVGFPYLAFWTPRKGAPFLCMEPWMGHGDFNDTKQDFYHREGTLLLSAKKTYTCAYTIEVW